MAISQKVSKPAVSPEWQSSITALSGDGVAGAVGITMCTMVAEQDVSIPDGHYNGQMCIIIRNAAANNAIVTPDSPLGSTIASYDVVPQACALFIWYSDGTTEGWACMNGNAGTAA